MRKTVFAILMLISSLLSLAPALAQVAPQKPAKPVVGGGEIPKPAIASIKTNSKSFLENKGQWDKDARFLSRTAGMDYWVTRYGVVLDYYRFEKNGSQVYRNGHVVRMTFDGGNTSAATEGLNRTAVNTDFIKLPDSEAGRKDMTTTRGAGSFGEAIVKDIYPGISLRNYIEGESPRYDFVVAPNADAKSIKMRFQGADAVRINKSGAIVIETSVGPIQHQDLVAFQLVNGKKVRIKASFTKIDDTSVTVNLGSYDRSKELVIDPLVYGTYIGGNLDNDDARAVTSDNAGNVYITGQTFSTDFPITAGPYGYNVKDLGDGYITALTGDAYNVTYVAYVGGVAQDSGDYVSIDQYGNVWVSGNTTSIRVPKDSESIIRKNNSADPNATNGTFVVQLNGLPAVTQNGAKFFVPNVALDPVPATVLPFNASNAAIAAFLNALSTKPPGDYVASGGPLPGSDVKLVSTDPGGNDFGLHPLVVFSRTIPYVLQNDAGPPQVQQLLWPDPTGTNPFEVGFRPNGGSFRLQFVSNLGTQITSAANPLPWNATAIQVQNALQAATPVINASPLGSVTCTGGPLPITPIDITFNGQSQQWPVIQMVAPTNTVNLVSGHYNRNTDRITPVPFVIKFEASAATVLDPATNPLFRTFEGANRLSAFGIRPRPTPAGNVEMAISGGVAGAVEGITDPVPTTPSGFILLASWTPGASVINISPTRSKYVTGGLPVSVTGSSIDGDGNIYVTGAVGDGINRILGPTSPFFVTTAGGWLNNNLLRANDAYIRKYNASGGLSYSGVFGGSGDDTATVITNDAFGNAYIVGTTASFNFPRTVGSFGQIFSGADQVYAAKINSTGSQVLYATGLRTTGNVFPRRAAVDSRGNLYIGGAVGFTILGAGPTLPGSIVTTPVAPNVPGQETALDPTYTNGNATFPFVQDAINGNFNSSTPDGFLTVLNATATGLLYSSYIGEQGSDDCLGVFVDKTGSVWCAGTTTVLNYNWEAGSALINNFVSGALTGTFGIPAAYINALAFKAVPDVFSDGWLFKMRIGLPTLQLLQVNPTQIPGGLGASTTGFVQLRSPAPVGGAQVTIRVLNPAVGRLQRVNGPTSQRITIPEGQQVGTFTVFSNRVLALSTLDVRAELEGDYLVSRLNVIPWLNSFSLSTDTTAGGNAVDMVLSLAEAAPTGGVDFTISSDLPQLAKYNGLVVKIPAGQQTVGLILDTEGVDVVRDVTLTAFVEGVGISQVLTLTPALVTSIAFDPVRVNGGDSSTATLQFDGKAVGNSVFNLSSTGAAVTLGTVTLAADGRSGTFTVGTTPVLSGSTASNITAALNGSSVTGTLFIDSNDVIGLNIAAPLVGGLKSILAGQETSGSVIMDKAATGSGITIPLVVSNPAVLSVIGTDANGQPLPNAVFIPPGATAGSFRIVTNSVLAAQSVTISTNKPPFTSRSDTLQVRRLAYTLTLAPTSVIGGVQNSTGTVQLLNGEVAPVGGLRIRVQSSLTSAASVPNPITLQAGQSSIQFPITTTAQSVDRVVSIDVAMPGGFTVAQNLTVVGASVENFTIQPSTVVGGATPSGTVTLNTNAPTGGVVVSISSADPASVSVPATVTVPSGSKTVSFPITTSAVAVQKTVLVTATRGATSRSASVTLTVAAPQSLVFSPSTVIAGSSSTGTFTLDQVAPAGGLVIDLSSNKDTFVTYPLTVTVAAGSRTATFTVVTKPVSVPIAAIFTAKVRVTGASVTGTLFIDRSPG